MFKRGWIIIISVCVLLAACSPSEEEALPTRIILPDDESSVSIVPTDSASPTETPVQSGLRPLPATFTPTPTETPIPTSTITPTPIIETGKILFLYNNDSIIRINDDGTGQELIITFGVERRISDLSLSPKGDIIAFVAPGNGSAREIWIANSTGTYLQQVTCLGYADIRHITWSADGQVLGFVASQTENSPLDIYTVGWQGANDCPTGNRQQLVLDRNSLNLGGLAFSADGGTLFFSDGQIYAINLANFSVTEALSVSIGFGGDFNLAYSPTANTLAYLQDKGQPVEGNRGGNLIGLNVATLDVVNTAFQDQITILKFVWRSDGGALLQSVQNRVVISPIGGGTSITVDSDTASFPNAVFSPDESQVAYFDSDSNIPNIPQIFVAPSSGGVSRQVTAVTEGQIGNFIWVSQ